MRTALKVVGLLLVVLVGVAGVQFARVRSQMPKTTGARIDVEPVATGVLAKFSYAWIVKTPHGAFLVDTGPDAKAEDLLSELKLQGVAAEAVHTILLTHGHEDHFAAASAFPKAKVVVGPGDASLVREERHTQPGPILFLMHTFGEPAPPVPPLIEELKGDATLDLDGVQVKAFSIPGHTKGSMAYLVGDVLFTGDSLMARPDSSLDLGPRLFCEDAGQNLASLARLRQIEFSRIADGHAGLTIDAKTRVETFLSHPQG
ncbi:MAG TPA: MBL fold metallo-hydrolase [Myxococcaceae bacterium]|jgi:glyoxylase-like metal-dependent hydrolase (beta-lactamase superfamily II)